MAKVDGDTSGMGGKSYPTPEPEYGNMGTVEDGQRDTEYADAAPSKIQTVDPKPGGTEMYPIPGLPFVKPSDMV